MLASLTAPPHAASYPTMYHTPGYSGALAQTGLCLVSVGGQCAVVWVLGKAVAMCCNAVVLDYRKDKIAWHIVTCEMTKSRRIRAWYAPCDGNGR